MAADVMQATLVLSTLASVRMEDLPVATQSARWFQLYFQATREATQALVRRGLSPERPIAILSENDLEHLTLALGAMWAGVPYTPVSSAYSLVSTDFEKLRQAFGLDQGMHLLAQPGIGDAQEAPGLHIADRGREVGGFDEPLKQSGGERFGLGGGDEVTHVAALAQGAPEGGNFGVAVAGIRRARAHGRFLHRNRRAVACGLEGKYRCM